MTGFPTSVLDYWHRVFAVDRANAHGPLSLAISAALWDDSPIADLGVLTLPDARGRGFARGVVHAIDRFSRQQGYAPQYRCQHDNHASIALAGSCGLTVFGAWIVAKDDSGSGDN